MQATKKTKNPHVLGRQGVDGQGEELDGESIAPAILGVTRALAPCPQGATHAAAAHAAAAHAVGGGRRWRRRCCPMT